MEKSSKEVARGAVEAEFRKRRGNKRQRGEYDDLHDDSSDDNSNDAAARSRRSSQEKEKLGKIDKEPSALQILAEKYRDRASERRQRQSDTITNGDAEADADANANTVVPFPYLMSKPEPKLRLAAEQIFEDAVDALESGDRIRLERLHRRSSQQQEVDPSRRIANVQDALEWISNPTVAGTGTRSQLEKSMLDYLYQEYLPPISPSVVHVSAAGRNLQCTRFWFNIASTDPRNRYRSWERPLEEATAAATLTHDNDGVMEKVTPCSAELIQEIKQSLDRKNLGATRVPVGTNNDTQKNVQRPNSSIEFAKGVKEPEKSETKDSNGNNKIYDDEEDDIFAEVGDYDGAAEMDAVRTDESKKSYSNAKHTKGSIFKNTDTAVSNVADATTVNIDATKSAVSSRGLQSLELLPGGGHYADDGIGLDFDGRDYDDDDADEIQQPSKSSKKTKKSRNARRADRSPS